MQGEPPDYIVRRYRASDRAQLEDFCCAHHGQKWEKAAQKVIREDFPGDAVRPGSGIALFVAVLDRTIIGVIGFGPDGDAEAIVVHSMGVALEYQGRGIGTTLKEHAMAECAARYGHVVLASVVHRRNTPMKRVNEKLGVRAEPDPEDGEYLLTGVIVEEAPEGDR